MFSLLLKVIVLFLIQVMFSITYSQELSSQQMDMLKGKIQDLLKNTDLITAVQQQNKANQFLSSNDIDKLDQQWRKEIKTGNGPLVSGVTDNKTSGYLRQFLATDKNLYREIFVMDAKGLNVGATEATSDYWQGDEEKWQKTFLVGPAAVHAEPVKYDDSTQHAQAQISFSIADPESNKPIGAVTFGINPKALK